MNRIGEVVAKVFSAMLLVERDEGSEINIWTIRYIPNRGEPPKIELRVSERFARNCAAEWSAEVSRDFFVLWPDGSEVPLAEFAPGRNREARLADLVREILDAAEGDDPDWNRDFAESGWAHRARFELAEG